MKKFTLLFSFILLISLSFSSCTEQNIDSNDASLDANKIPVPELECTTMPNDDNVDYCGEPQECTMWAGQNIDAGTVKMGNDEENLYITVHSKDGFQNVSENIKIWVGTDLNDVPTNGGGNPQIGQFPCKATVAQGVETLTFVVKLEDLIPDWSSLKEDEVCSTEKSKLYFAVHADVNVGNGDGSRGETAWGGCMEFEDIIVGNPGSWWTTMEYTAQCCDEDEKDGCWCGFGFDYLNPQEECCLSMNFEGVDYIFWSNEIFFKSLMETSNYELPLLANSTDCIPLDTDGNLIEGVAADRVGLVELNVVENNDGRFIYVTYTINDDLVDYKKQLDFYLGKDQVPEYDLENQKIIESDDNKIYQIVLEDNELTKTFMVPWPSTEKAFIAVHSAIGDCPMPDLQNDMGASPN